MLEIKARALLPREEEEIELDEEIISEEEEIQRRMIEYQLLQEKAKEIKNTETLNRFYREQYLS